MKSRSGKLAGAVAFMAILGACAVAQAGDKANGYIEVPQITKLPVIDGVLQNGEWDGTAVGSFSGASTPNSVKFHAGWMPDSLWFAVEVTDPYLFGSKENLGDYVWEDDSLEIFIDTENSSEDTRTNTSYQFLFSPAGGYMVAPALDGTLTLSDEFTGDIKFAMKKDGTLDDDSDTDKGYIIELKIPVSGLAWEGYACPTLKAGMSMGLAVHNKARDTEGNYEEVNWSLGMAQGQAPHIPSSWGEMKLK